MARMRSFNELGAGQQFALITLAGFFSSLAVWALQSRLSASSWALSTFIDPESVADIAAQFPGSEDAFTLEAWNYVGSQISYEGYGSILNFYDTTVRCDRCLLADEVLESGVANCVGKSVLLTSILRNRYSPDRVYMVIGKYKRSGQSTGHAWVEVDRGGTWYVLEATATPPTIPWVPVGDLSSVYLQDVFINDKGILCYDDEYCPTTKVVIKAKPCDACRLT
jgi:hypothetical protein